MNMRQLLSGFKGLEVETSAQGGKTTITYKGPVSLAKEKSTKSRYAPCVIGIFSKKACVKAMKTKQPPEVRDAFGEAIQALGPPSSIYTDENGGMQREFADFLKKQGIQHRIT